MPVTQLDRLLDWCHFFDRERTEAHDRHLCAIRQHDSLAWFCSCHTLRTGLSRTHLQIAALVGLLRRRRGCLRLGCLLLSRFLGNL